MSVDSIRWVNTLPIINPESNQEKYKLDSDRWVSTLHITTERSNQKEYKLDSRKQVNDPSKINKDNPIKSYSLIITLFVVGLMFISVIKNETRNLQKKINNLQTSINILKFDLHQATLEHEVITSPENISRLAKEYLESNLVTYNKSQIRQLNENVKTLTRLEKTIPKKNFIKKNKKITREVNIRVADTIESKKTGFTKLQELYSMPKKLPDEMKLLLAKNIESKKKELKQFYSEPSETIKLGKVQKWAGIQVLKAILGIPIVPGR